MLIYPLMDSLCFIISNILPLNVKIQGDYGQTINTQCFKMCVDGPLVLDHVCLMNGRLQFSIYIHMILIWTSSRLFLEVVKFESGQTSKVESPCERLCFYVQFF